MKPRRAEPPAVVTTTGLCYIATMEALGKLVLTEEDGREREFALEKEKILLGRATTSDITISSAKASRTHSRLERSEGRYVIIDLGSANGTIVNGEAVERAILSPGDVIRLGESVLRYEESLPAAEAEDIPINSEADLETTLTQATVAVAINETSVPRLAVYTKRKTFETPLTREILMIGRGRECDIFLDDPKVSREHARVQCDGGKIVISDLNSRNGTWLGRRRIDKHTFLDGDTVRIGDARLVFKRGFVPEDLTVEETTGLAGKDGRRPVVFIPGLMGSELWRDGEKVWPNPRNLFTLPEMLTLPDTAPVEVGSVSREVVFVPNLIKLEQYRGIIEYLGEGLGYEPGKDLIEFAYD